MIDSKTFKAKYNNKQKALFAMYQLFAVAAKAEQRRHGIYNLSFPINALITFFPDGLSVIKEKSRLLIVFVYSEEEMHTNRMYEYLSNSLRGRIDLVVFVCLDNIKNYQSKNKKYVVFGFETIITLFSNYISEIDSLDIEDDNENGDESSNVQIVEEGIDSVSKKQSLYHQIELSNYFKENKKNCAFILGNGISIPFGADPWNKMINNLVDYLSPFYIQSSDIICKSFSESNYLISGFVKETLLAKQLDDIYYSALRYCVYRKYHKEMLSRNSLIRSIALAKIKYPTLRLLTYNYDTFLENQLKYENNKKQIKSIISKTNDKAYLNGVIHLHGYIKEEGKFGVEKSSIVLSENDYYKTYFNKDSWSYLAQKETLQKCITLFIGSSMSDLFQLSIINEVYQEMGDEWFCYALMCFERIDEPTKEELINYYLKKHIKIIYVDEFNQLTKTLNKITNIVFKNNNDKEYKN